VNTAVVIDPKASTRHEFAKVDLVATLGTEFGQLDIDLAALAGVPAPEWALDLLVFSSAVYALDKLVARSSAPDGWTREFKLAIPVAAPRLWRAQQERLVDALCFLTGDQWKLSFTKREHTIFRPRPRRRPRAISIEPTVVCLLSGGLDSLIGAIDRLDAEPNVKLLLVGHHDGQMAGPLDDQRRLLKGLRSEYPDRTASLLVRVGHGGTAQEITLRSRSLVFIALGTLAAAMLGPDVPLLMPENGTISVNVPLTPSRRGSCSTRTTHPHFLELMRTVIDGLGGTGRLENPLQFETKGEAVTLCRNQSFLRAIASDSVSCAKRGHTSTWRRRTANGCGRCMPCIYRRAALHAAGIDTETYGLDICKGEVDLEARGEEGPNDLRACFSFLRRRPSTRDVERLLITSGPLDLAALPAHAGVVERAMDEIRKLISDKATKAIKASAGVT
jgi:hypothetical protein